MIDTIVRTRPRPGRDKALDPSIREVCLVGSPRRTYVHIPAEGLKSKESEPRKS
jgi:hypothetical protein